MFRFNFHGGFLDGRTLASGKGPDGAPMPGERYVFLSDGGRLGTRFRETPPERDAKWRRMLAIGPVDRDLAREFRARLAQLGSQVYEVTHRDERSDEIVVRVDFVGEESAGTTIGGATDDPYVVLIVEIRFPAGRPTDDDVATRDAILAELLQHCLPTPSASGEEPGALCFSTPWADEATGRQRIADVLGRLLPGIEFEITALPGP
ncbi:MAG TPA: hypothetical protein VIK18_12425 [Pirellulales bacterium]